MDPSFEAKMGAEILWVDGKRECGDRKTVSRRAGDKIL